MKLNPTLLALAAAAAFTGSSHALVVTGTTTGAPTFNRPTSTTSLSGIGTAVPYTVLPFTVSAAGSYAFLTTSTTTSYDPFIALYTAFNPATPLANVLAVNDDFSGSLTQSGFNFTLAVGTTYRLVVTGFDNLDFGSYSTSITGPGNVVAIPEPATYLLMAGGLLGLGALKRRSRSSAAA